MSLSLWVVVISVLFIGESALQVVVPLVCVQLTFMAPHKIFSSESTSRTRCCSEPMMHNHTTCSLQRGSNRPFIAYSTRNSCFFSVAAISHASTNATASRSITRADKTTFCMAYTSGFGAAFSAAVAAFLSGLAKLSVCWDHNVAVRSTIAPHWCEIASGIGTQLTSVVMPSST